MPIYDKERIADELEAIALGKAFYGNALYVARDIPDLTKSEKGVLARWLLGIHQSQDYLALQEIANKLRRTNASLS